MSATVTITAEEYAALLADNAALHALSTQHESIKGELRAVDGRTRSA